MYLRKKIRTQSYYILQTSIHMSSFHVNSLDIGQISMGQVTEKSNYISPPKSNYSTSVRLFRLQNLTAPSNKIDQTSIWLKLHR